MDRLKCSNKDCGKTFLLPAKIMVERKPLDFAVTRIVVEKPCCLFCEGLEFEEVA